MENAHQQLVHTAECGRFVVKMCAHKIRFVFLVCQWLHQWNFSIANLFVLFMNHSIGLIVLGVSDKLPFVDKTFDSDCFCFANDEIVEIFVLQMMKVLSSFDTRVCSSAIGKNNDFSLP